MTDEDFEAHDVAAAERLDAEIDGILAGSPARRTDPAALWLATSLRSTPPPRLRRRLAGLRPGGLRARLPQLCAAALAVVVFWHGLSGQLLGEWVARNLGEPHSPHAYIEGSWALMAVAIAIGCGAVRRRWLPVSVGTGVPLGVAMGAGGITEFAVFPAGGVLHAVEAALALVLFATWWVSSRYSLRRRPESGA